MRARPFLGGVLAGAALTIAADALRIYNRREVEQAESRFPPTGEYVTVNGVRLHYVRRGSGPPVFLFHGAAGTLHDFDALLEPLAEDFTVYAFDRPGHGYSQPQPADGRSSAEQQAHLFRAAARQLGLERPILLGYSWSAVLVLLHALRYPTDTGACVLVGGTSHVFDEPINPLYWLLRTPLAGELLLALGLVPIGRPYVAVPLSRAFAPDPLSADYLERARCLWLRHDSVRALTRDLTTLRQALEPLRDRYAELSTPVVALTGDADRLVDPRRNTFRLRADLPFAEVMVAPGAGHALPHTRPEAVARAVRRAAELRDAWSGPRSATP